MGSKIPQLPPAAKPVWPESQTSAIADKPPAAELEPFVNLFQMKWNRTKQSTFTPPNFSKNEVRWY